MSCIRYYISCAQHACAEYTTVNLYVSENNWVSLFKIRHNGMILLMWLWQKIHMLNTEYCSGLILCMWHTIQIFNIVETACLLTMRGDILPIAPTFPVTFRNMPVPSVAPKNSTIFGILNLFLNSSQISILRPFPKATRTLWTPSRSLWKREWQFIKQFKFYIIIRGIIFG